MNGLQTADYIVFAFYFVLVALYGYYVYQKKSKTSSGDSKDFFLAEGSLTWWAIGASLIASNISAEHFIGMSGSGFALGLAISTYGGMHEERCYRCPGRAACVQCCRLYAARGYRDSHRRRRRGRAPTPRSCRSPTARSESSPPNTPRSCAACITGWSPGSCTAYSTPTT